MGALAVTAWMVAGAGVGAALAEVAQRPGAALAVVLFTLVGAALHELGHAAASRYGGASPGTIGVGVYLIWPVFFNDLDDSYRLDRRGRLRCDLGGVYLNLVFALALAGAYGLTGEVAFLAAVFVQQLAVVQQFLPFVRLDGYYVVSDLAGVPDLFAYVRPVVRRLLGRPGGREALDGLTPKARALVTAWVLLTIPLIAVALSLLVVGVPHLVAGLRHSWSLVGSWLGGAGPGPGPLTGLLAGLQLALLAIPVVGQSAVVGSLVRGLGNRRPQVGAAPIVATVPVPASAPAPGWWHESAAWAGPPLQSGGRHPSVAVSWESWGAPGRGLGTG